MIEKKYTIALCGNDEYNDETELFLALDYTLIKRCLDRPDVKVVCAGPNSVSKLVSKWATMRKIESSVYVYNADEYGAQAIQKCDEKMFQNEQPDLLLSFGGNARFGCIKRLFEEHSRDILEV